MKKLLLSLFALTAFAAIAQTTPQLPPLPQSKAEFWDLGIMFVTPLIVWGVSKIPNLPTALLPTITPLVGIILGYALNWLGNANLGWVDMAKAGALAVFVREVFNQWVTKQKEGSQAAVTPPTAARKG